MPVTVEVHLFDFDQDLYGKTLRVILAKFIRPEIKFDGFDAIRAQIVKDSHMARSTLLETTLDQLLRSVRAMSVDYKSTVFLPKTDFPMRLRKTSPKFWPNGRAEPLPAAARRVQRSAEICAA